MPKKKLHAILLIFLIVSKDYNFSCTGQISFWKTKPSFNPSFQNAAHSWSKSRVCINSSAQNNSEVMKPMARKPHKLVDYKGWQFLSLVGVVGTCSKKEDDFVKAHERTALQLSNCYVQDCYNCNSSHPFTRGWFALGNWDHNCLRIA